MRFLGWLTQIFIDTFGITHPRPEQRRLASLLIGGFLLGCFLAMIGVAAYFIVLLSK